MQAYVNFCKQPPQQNERLRGNDRLPRDPFKGFPLTSLLFKQGLNWSKIIAIMSKGNLPQTHAGSSEAIAWGKAGLLSFLKHSSQIQGSERTRGGTSHRVRISDWRVTLEIPPSVGSDPWILLPFLKCQRGTEAYSSLSPVSVSQYAVTAVRLR